MKICTLKDSIVTKINNKIDKRSIQQKMQSISNIKNVRLKLNEKTIRRELKKKTL